MSILAEQVAAELCTDDALAYAEDFPADALRRMAVDAYRRGLVDMARDLRGRGTLSPQACSSTAQQGEPNGHD